MKRILLLLATNLAIVLVLSITMRLLGVEPYLRELGLNLQALLIFAAVMGFSGSFISLAISRWMGDHRESAKETQIYSVLSFPRKREPSQIKHLDSRFRGNDELICTSLIRNWCR